MPTIPWPGFCEDGRLTRADIETLCILSAIGDNGCAVGDLSSRLGLAAGLNSVISEAVVPLANTGLIELRGERVSLTESGLERLSRK